jgi:hypothetical protein
LSKRVSMPKMILSKTPYAWRHSGVAKSGDTSGKKARDGVASTDHVQKGTNMNFVPYQID